MQSELNATYMYMYMYHAHVHIYIIYMYMHMLKGAKQQVYMSVSCIFLKYRDHYASNIVAALHGQLLCWNDLCTCTVGMYVTYKTHSYTLIQTCCLATSNIYMLDFIQRGVLWHSSKLASFSYNLMLNKHYVTGILLSYMYIHVQASEATSDLDLHIFVGHLPTLIPLYSVASPPSQKSHVKPNLTCIFSTPSIVCYAHAMHLFQDYCNVQKISTIHVHV